ncbi:DUF58 domain-containing protein [bacterium]|nr:DUF58 domain-containing protein [bacterium]
MSATRIELADLTAMRQHAAAVDLSSRRRVHTDLAGPKLSGFRGRGMEFEEHRLYAPGDDVRSMDWRVTARTGQPHVRLYREERERPVILAVDLRLPMQFGTRGCFKAVQAARAAALCGWAAVRNGDRVGGLCFAGGQHSEVRPAGGRRGMGQLLHALVADNARATDRPAALFDALQRLLHTARSGSLVALFSDFRGLDDNTEDLLRRLGRRCELIIGHVHDPLERQLPPPGQYPIRDGEDEHPALIDTAQRRTRQQWAQQFQARHTALTDLCRASRGHWLDLPTDLAAHDAVSRSLGRRRLAA